MYAFSKIPFPKACKNQSFYVIWLDDDQWFKSGGTKSKPLVTTKTKSSAKLFSSRKHAETVLRNLKKRQCLPYADIRYIPAEMSQR